jgi:hypothetical protein
MFTISPFGRYSNDELTQSVGSCFVPRNQLENDLDRDALRLSLASTDVSNETTLYLIGYDLSISGDRLVPEVDQSPGWLSFGSN